MEPRDAGSPFEPPGGLARPAADASEAEVQLALHYGRAVVFLLVATGLIQAAQVAQLLLFAYQGQAEILVAEGLFGAQAVALWAVALRVSDGSSRHTLLAAALGLGGALSAGGWWLWLLLHGVVSLLPLGIAPLSAASGLACLVFLRQAALIERARSLDEVHP